MSTSTSTSRMPTPRRLPTGASRWVRRTCCRRPGWKQNSLKIGEVRGGGWLAGARWQQQRQCTARHAQEHRRGAGRRHVEQPDADRQPGHEWHGDCREGTDRHEKARHRTVVGCWPLAVQAQQVPHAQGQQAAPAAPPPAPAPRWPMGASASPVPRRTWATGKARRTRRSSSTSSMARRSRPHRASDEQDAWTRFRSSRHAQALRLALGSGGRSAHALQAFRRPALLAHALWHRDRRPARDARKSSSCTWARRTAGASHTSMAANIRRTSRPAGTDIPPASGKATRWSWTRSGYNDALLADARRCAAYQASCT